MVKRNCYSACYASRLGIARALLGRWACWVCLAGILPLVLIFTTGCASTKSNYAIRGKGIFRPAGCHCTGRKRKNLHSEARRDSLRVPEVRLALQAQPLNDMTYGPEL
ncbi:MAG: hypothetical protein ACFNUE_03050 [Bacteroides sp.]